MLEISNLHDLGEIEQYCVAHEIACATKAQSSDNLVVPVGAEEILQSELAIVAFIDGDFAGFIRAKEAILDLQISSRNFRQLGTLVVVQAFRRIGIGEALIVDMTDIVVAKREIPYAFCNPISQLGFCNAEYRPANPGELPETAVSLYGNQPMIYKHYLRRRQKLIFGLNMAA